MKNKIDKNEIVNIPKDREQVNNYQLLKIKTIISSKTVKNGLFILTSSFLVSPINFIFWILAARYFEEKIIGVVTSLLNLLMWFALIARLGLEDGIKRFLPELDKNKLSSFINTGVIFSLVLLIPILSLSFFILNRFVKDYPQWVWSFPMITLSVLFVSGININTIFDSIVIGSARSKVTIWKVLLIGTLKLLLLPLFSFMIEIGLFLSIDLALWLPALILWFFILPKIVKEYKIKSKPLIKEFAIIFKYSLKHFIYNILVNSPTAILPLIVLIQRSKTEAAYFSIGWLFINVAYSVSLSLGTSFMVESVKSPKSTKRNFILIVISILGIISFGVLIFLIFGNFILSLFGAGYSQAYTYVLLGLLSAFPYSFNSIYFNYCKVRNKMNLIIIITAIHIIILFAGTILTIKSNGLIVISVFLFIANLISSLVILIIEFPKIKRFIITIKGC